VLRIRAGDPALGPLPADPQALQGSPNGLPADPLRGQPALEADVGRQLQGPQTGRFPEGAGALVQQGPELFPAGGVEGDAEPTGPGGALAQGREAPAVERGEGVTNGLGIAP